MTLIEKTTQSIGFVCDVMISSSVMYFLPLRLGHSCKLIIQDLTPLPVAAIAILSILLEAKQVGFLDGQAVIIRRSLVRA